jgi:hypothetical protein
MRVFWCIGCLLCLAWAGYVNAEPPTGTPPPFWHGLGSWGRVCPSVGCCPDDYVHKPFPSICPISHCGGPDDYCRKLQPCVPALPHCGSPDNYCSKLFPCLLCPPVTPYLHCGPPDGPCPTCGNRR